MAVELALYQPDIAHNTGTLLRLGACLGVRLHIIRPTGFVLSRQTLRRSGLDYLETAQWMEHDSFAAFEAWRRDLRRRLVVLTTGSDQSLYRARFDDTDLLLMGRESAGVPPAVHQAADLRLRIPMQPGRRSVNVAVAAALALGEAMRQTHAFEELA